MARICHKIASDVIICAVMTVSGRFPKNRVNILPIIRSSLTTLNEYDKPLTIGNQSIRFDCLIHTCPCLLVNFGLMHKRGYTLCVFVL